MKITEHLSNTKETPVTFEILPPLRGKGIQGIFNVLDPLMEFNPPFIDVTYHREEYIYKKRPGGYFEKVSTKKRPGTVSICAAIMNRYKVDAVPHLTCGGFTKSETEDALIDLNFLGVDNVLLIRGDAAKHESSFTPEEGGNEYAIDLLKQVKRMSNGIYLEEELENAAKTDFCVGVAGYPEKHFESPNLKSDLKYLKAKVDAGADYIVTQMFFDNRKYFEFVEACRNTGIEVPIVPGLKPITKKSQVNIIPSVFHVDFPDDLADALDKCKDDKAATEVGIEWLVNQSKELLAYGVPCLHYYIMWDYLTTKKVVSQIR